MLVLPSTSQLRSVPCHPHSSLLSSSEQEGWVQGQRQTVSKHASDPDLRALLHTDILAAPTGMCPGRDLPLPNHRSFSHSCVS